MIEALLDILCSLISVIKRFWKQLTGRSPKLVPVPVRARRTIYSHPISITLADHRTPTDASRLRGRW